VQECLATAEDLAELVAKLGNGNPVTTNQVAEALLVTVPTAQARLIKARKKGLVAIARGRKGWVATDRHDG
jgi:Mn-dependent DtxR family transcriptional regulator